MKKLILLLVLALCSCTSEDNNTTPQDIKERLLKTWYFVQAEDLNVNEIGVADDCEQNRNIIFYQDDTFKEVFYNFNNSNNCNQTWVDLGTYQVTSENTLTLTIDDENYNYRIVSLTSNVLAIEYIEQSEIYTYSLEID